VKDLFAGFSRKYNINNVVPASTVFALVCTVASIISPEPASAAGFSISGEAKPGDFGPSKGQLFVAPKGGKVKVPVNLTLTFTVKANLATVGEVYQINIIQKDPPPFKVTHAGVEFFGRISDFVEGDFVGLINNGQATEFEVPVTFYQPDLKTLADFPNLSKGEYKTDLTSVPEFLVKFKEIPSDISKDPAKQQITVSKLGGFNEPPLWKVIESPMPGVPGPLPLLGAAAAFTYSRKLRRSLKPKGGDANSQKP
jgi:hypothetical protein